MKEVIEKDPRRNGVHHHQMMRVRPVGTIATTVTMVMLPRLPPETLQLGKLPRQFNPTPLRMGNTEISTPS